MFTSEDKKQESIDGQELITFKANTITYGIPKDHPIGKEVSQAKIGVVFHTHYNGTSLDTMSAAAGAPVDQFSKTTDVAVIKNDTPINDVAMDKMHLQRINIIIYQIGLNSIIFRLLTNLLKNSKIFPVNGILKFSLEPEIISFGN